MASNGRWALHVMNTVGPVVVRDNVLNNWNGAGVFVDSLSSYNTVDHNFVTRVTGTSSRLRNQRALGARPGCSGPASAGPP